MFATWNEEDGRFGFTLEPRDKTSMELSDEDHAALFEAQAEGKQIVRGDDGSPALADSAPTWAAVQRGAAAALAANDRVAMRCVKAGVSYPAEWRQYDAALVAIVNSSSGNPLIQLPDKPAYPAGT